MNSGFDWNGNKKSDAFDSFMDMNISSGKQDDTNQKTESSSEKSNKPDHRKTKGISMGGKPLYDATKDSNGMVILKCLLATASCFGGIAMPVISGLGGFGAILSVFSGLGIGILILKNV